MTYADYLRLSDVAVRAYDGREYGRLQEIRRQHPEWAPDIRAYQTAAANREVSRALAHLEAING